MYAIRSYYGYAALNGAKWALLAQYLIESLPWFGDGHCFDSIEWDEVNQPPFDLWK